MKFKVVGVALAVGCMLVGTAVLAGGMGVVDMEKVIKSHPNTKADREILQQYIDDYEAEREEVLAQMEKIAAEFEELRIQADDDALSPEKREAKRGMAKMKFEERRRLERDVRRDAMARQKELTNREVQMRKRVVAKVTKIVKSVAASEGVDWIFSSSDSDVDAFPLVVLAPEAADLTDKVLEAIVTPSAE